MYSMLSIDESMNDGNESVESDQTSQTNETVNNSVSNLSSISLSSCPSGLDLTNVIFIDWDDTLMPTTYLLSNIDYEINENQRIKCFNINANNNPQQVSKFIADLEKTGNAAFNFLKNVISRFDIGNIKIVTNGIKGWLPESLFVAGTFCEIYKKIDDLIKLHQIEIIYARNNALDHNLWKTQCFDQLLWPYFTAKTKNNLNVITVGDQWTDHHSIERSLTYSAFGQYINHHQIKFFAGPDARYLGVELQYVSNLLMDEEILFIKTEEKEQGIVLEFDGYDDE